MLHERMFALFGCSLWGRVLMNNDDIERLLKEAKILYWKENDKVIFQQKHIGKPDNMDKLLPKNLGNEVELSKGDDKKCVEV